MPADTCQLVSEASCVTASSRWRVASFCSNICSRCKASYEESRAPVSSARTTQKNRSNRRHTKIQEKKGSVSSKSCHVQTTVSPPHFTHPRIYLYPLIRKCYTITSGSWKPSFFMHMLHMLSAHRNKLFFPRLKNTSTFLSDLSNKTVNTKRQLGSSHAMSCSSSNQVTKEKCQARTTIFVWFLVYDSKIEEHLR